MYHMHDDLNLNDMDDSSNKYIITVVDVFASLCTNK